MAVVTDFPEALFGALRLHAGHVLLTVVGEIDVATVGRFRALVAAAVAVEPSHVTIDLAGIEYMGLCAVPVLESAAAELAKRGGRCTLRLASPAVSRLLAASGLAATLEIEASGSEAALLRRLAASGALPLERQVLDAALGLVVTMAQAVVSGADGVSITLPRHGRLGTVAASNQVVLEMDRDQYDTGEGPCLDAALQGERFQIEALGDEPRWPAFVPRARARGIESILSTPLVSADRPIGALNIYSLASSAFAAHERAWADQFAAEAAVVVTVAEGAGPTGGLDSELVDALRSREAIAMAQGMVLQRDKGTPEAAYAVLRAASCSTDRTLREISEAMVREGIGALPRVVDGAG